MAFTDEELMAICNNYTDKTVLGGGAIKGKNCTIKSITQIQGGNRVTFEWTLDDGTVETDTMDVMDGQAPSGVYVDKDQFDDNFETIPGGNLIELPDGVLKAGNVTAVVKDNTITLNGTVSANNYLYIKASNTVEMVQATGAKAVPDAWAAESMDILTSGKKYAFDVFALSGTVSTSVSAPSVTLKDSGKNTSQSSGTLFTYTGGAAYMQLFCGKESTFNDFKVAVMLTEGAVPEQFVDKDVCLEAYEGIYAPYIYRVADETNFVTIPNTDYASTSSIYCQGSCVADGNLFIVFMNNSHTYINKYSLLDGSLVDSVQMDSIHHGNDLTYNPFDGYIYAVDLDSPNVIHKIATDLTYVSSVQVDLTDIYPGYTGIGAISYNAKRNVFVCLLRGTRKGYAVLDNAFNFADIIWSRNCGGQYGGIYADDEVIYQASAEPSMIHVISYDGTYVGRLHDLGKLSLEDTNRWEPESLSIVGDKIYVAYNSPLHNTKTYVDVFDISSRVQGLIAKV